MSRRKRRPSPLESLKRRRLAVANPRRERALDVTVQALRDGVGYRITPPSPAVLLSSLERGIPPILPIDPQALYR
jgi:hypothetical protein